MNSFANTVVTQVIRGPPLKRILGSHLIIGMQPVSSNTLVKADPELDQWIIFRSGKFWSCCCT